MEQNLRMCNYSKLSNTIKELKRTWRKFLLLIKCNFTLLSFVLRKQQCLNELLNVFAHSPACVSEVTFCSLHFPVFPLFFCFVYTHTFIHAQYFDLCMCKEGENV